MKAKKKNNFFLIWANLGIVALRQHQTVKDVFQRKGVISYSFFLRIVTIPMCFYDLILIIFHESLKILDFKGFLKRKSHNVCDRNNDFYDYKSEKLQIMNRGIFKPSWDLSGQSQQNKH